MTPRKVLSAIVLFLLLAAYSVISVRQWVADAYANSAGQPRGLETAVRLDRSNAEYFYRLGLHYYFVEQDWQAAAQAYRSAVNLNPRSGRYWLALAAAHEVLGNTAAHRDAVSNAVLAQPTDPDIAWQAGNLLLVNGDIDGALHQLRVVIEFDDLARPDALDLCWRATHDAKRILQHAIPPSPDIVVAFLRLVVSQKDAAAAQTVWSQLQAMHPAIDPALAFPYIDFLLSRRAVGDARTIWTNVLEWNSLKTYLGRENLITNGGFEENMLNGGFDWRFGSVPGAELTIDSTDCHSGVHSLLVQFTGEPLDDPGIRQVIAVEPNAHYEFSAFAKSDEIISASGPRLAIRDYVSGENYVLTTDRMRETHPWTELKSEFTTGPNTNVVVLYVNRVPAAPRIKGSFWIDDLRLVKESKSNGAEP